MVSHFRESKASDTRKSARHKRERAAHARMRETRLLRGDTTVYLGISQNYEVSGVLDSSPVLSYNAKRRNKRSRDEPHVASLGYLNDNENSDQRFNPSLKSTNAMSKVWNVE